jgi:hypothetical protein
MPVSERNVHKDFLRRKGGGRDDKLTQYKYDKKHCFEEFNTPIAASAVTGAVAAGTTGATNSLRTPYNFFEYHIKGAGQTILAPVATTAGLDISLDQTDDEGIEITPGILADNRRSGCFKVGTSAAFFVRCKFTIVDVSGTDDCAIGFRKAEAYQANIDDYDEAAFLNVISGDIKTETILNNAATVTTDSTLNWADGETHELEVRVSAGGAVTYLVDGASFASAVAFTFDAGEFVIPFIFFLHAADVAGAVTVIEFEYGLQEVQAA